MMHARTVSRESETVDEHETAEHSKLRASYKHASYYTIYIYVCVYVCVI